MKNHFYIAYAGNKRNEVKDIYDNINFENITTIIEPFCGSCAMSYYISLHKKNLKYILNDNNIFLKEMYEIIKDDEKLKKFEEDYKYTMNNIIIDKLSYNEFLKNKDNDKLLQWFIKHKVYSLRAGLYPPSNKKITKEIDLKKYPIYNFFKNNDIEFLNIDGLECYKKYKSNPNNLILIDPPYLSSFNGCYKDPSFEIYEYLHNNNIINENAYIVLILEKMWIIELLFKNNNIKLSYDKTYQMSNKKKTIHIIIDNYII